MLRIHFMQQWFGLSDPAMEKALTDAFGDAGYQGIAKRPDAKATVNWHVAMRYSKRKALDKANEQNALTNQMERIKGSIRAKVEHPFRVIKRHQEKHGSDHHAVCLRQLVDG